MAGVEGLRQGRDDSTNEQGKPHQDAWSYLAYCPNCGTKLQSIKCKARCLACGFFQDCGDTIV